MAKPAIVIGDGKFATKDTKFLGYAQGDSSSRFVARELTYDRGSNLTATRVASNGLIEKGRENLFRNTVFAGAGLDTEPTGGSKFIDSTGGTFNVTSTAGQLRFITASDERAFIQSHSVTTASLYSFSVFVDKVVTTLAVNHLISDSGEATDIRYEEDGVEISTSTNVQAGKRYTLVVNKTNTNSTRFRIGSGTSSRVAGDVTLSKPQLEVGIVATDYIENTSTSAAVKAGILEDQARVDYLSNSNGYLLLEPTRQNLVPHSEYAGGFTEVGTGTVTDNHSISPEGVKNAFQLSESSTGFYRIEKDITVASENVGDHTLSVFIKKTTGALSHYAGVQLDSARKYVIVDTTNGTANEHNGTANDSFSVEDFSDDYWRVAITNDLTSAADYRIGLWPSISLNGITIGATATGSNVFYGVQLEKGAFATSYIPTHGTAASRSAEGLPASTGAVVDMSSFMKGDDVTIVIHWADNPTQIRDSSSGGIRLSNGDAQSGSIRFYRNGGSALQLRAVFFGTDGNNNSVTLASSTPKVAISRVRSTGVFTVYLDGSPLDVGLTDANGQFTNSNFDVTWDDLQISGSSQQKILLVKLFDRALTNSGDNNEMASETT